LANDQSAHLYGEADWFELAASMALMPWARVGEEEEAPVS